MLPRTNPHTSLLLGQLDALSVVILRGQETRKQSGRLGCVRRCHARGVGVGSSTPLSMVSAGATPPSSSACAPIYTPTTTSRRRRVRRIQPDTSIMRATDNHHADTDEPATSHVARSISLVATVRPTRHEVTD